VSGTVTVTRTYLELPSLTDLKPAKIEDDLLRLARVPVPSVPLAQRLYREVGDAYNWHDRWKWTEQQWREWVSRPGYGTWILTYDGELAGFFDLHWDEAGNCELELFGLVKKFHGRGFGKHLLTMVAEIAFAVGTDRLWLHTCTLDDEAALPNYLARGFRPFRTESYKAEVKASQSKSL